MPGFAELAARSHYSFLEGSASPKRMVQTAARLGIAALGLCDRNGLYGAVELIQSAKAQGIHPIIGTELELAGGSRIRLLARSRTGYRQLCRAVSASQLAGVKGQPRLLIDGISSGAQIPPAPNPRKRPTLPPPERPASLRPTAGPFPEGWPGLPSTTLLVESDPARIDPAALDDCIALIGGAR
jgi:hypothetical protein